VHVFIIDSALTENVGGWKSRITLRQADKQNREYEKFFPSFSFCFIEDIKYKDTIFRNIYSISTRIELSFDILHFCVGFNEAEKSEERRKNVKLPNMDHQTK